MCQRSSVYEPALNKAMDPKFARLNLATRVSFKSKNSGNRRSIFIVEKYGSEQFQIGADTFAETCFYEIVGIIDPLTNQLILNFTVNHNGDPMFFIHVISLLNRGVSFPKFDANFRIH